MSLDQIKSQLITIFAVKGDNNISGLIYGIMMLTIIDYFIKIIPTAGRYIEKFIKDKYSENVFENLAINKNIKSRIIFKKNNNSNTISDALIDYFTKKNETIDLYYNEYYIINREEEIEIDKNIFVKVIEKIYDKTGKIDKLGFEVYSYEYQLCDLKRWVDKINHNYIIMNANKFGDKKFFFDEIYSEGRMNPEIEFKKIEFNTNKNLDNIYGSQIKIIRDRVRMFIKNPEWYKKRGIPHTLGILLHGPPGTGKTSTIKAIANETRRHIFNIKLRDDTSPQQLQKLFFDERVRIEQSDFFETVTIPHEDRIYVIEDIDCLTSVVLDRELQETKNNKEEIKVERFKGGSSVKPKEKLTLSFLLNLFDGILETPGRIMIMTSNYPEKLDKALIRPGRIDLNLNLGFCDKNTIEEMFTSFYNVEGYSFDDFSEKVTPAYVQSILCNNYNDPENAYKQLIG